MMTAVAVVSNCEEQVGDVLLLTASAYTSSQSEIIYTTRMYMYGFVYIIMCMKLNSSKFYNTNHQCMVLL